MVVNGVIQLVGLLARSACSIYRDSWPLVESLQTVDYSQEPRVYSLNQAGHRSNKHLPDRHLSKRFRCGTENANEQCPLAL